MNKKALAILLVCMVIILGIGSYYFYSVVAVTLPDATACQAFKIERAGELKCEWLTAHDQSDVEPAVFAEYLGTHPAFGSGEYIVTGPIQCGSSVLERVDKVLADPTMYNRPGMNKSRFVPNYAFKLSGASGTLNVFIDLTNDWYEAKRYDRQGKCIKDSELRRCGNAWVHVLKQIFPSDKITND